MIRLVQRRLIIPRGDTGSFSIPTIAAASSADVAIFTIFDCLTRSIAFQKTLTLTGGEEYLEFNFTHNDTVNLMPGNYFWDIKFYKNPVYLDEELVDGEEVDSYYAGFKLPECEIRETGDNLLVSPNAPQGTLTPEQLNIIGSALTALTNAVSATAANVSHYPKIENGYWYVWDSDAGEYVNTNVSASGTAGAQGPAGPAGNSGVYIGTSEPSDGNINVWINPEGQATNIIGVPDGGTTGQVLKKKSNTDYDVEWNNESSGVILFSERIVDENNIYLEYNNSTIIDESLFTSGFCMLKLEEKDPEGDEILYIQYCPLMTFVKTLDLTVPSIVVTFSLGPAQGLEFEQQEDGTWKLLAYY